MWTGACVAEPMWSVPLNKSISVTVPSASVAAIWTSMDVPAVKLEPLAGLVIETV